MVEIFNLALNCAKVMAVMMSRRDRSHATKSVTRFHLVDSEHTVFTFRPKNKKMTRWLRYCVDTSIIVLAAARGLHRQSGVDCYCLYLVWKTPWGVGVEPHKTLKRLTRWTSTCCFRSAVQEKMSRWNHNFGIFNCRMLQNNQLKTVPSAALKNLHSLQSL